MNTIKISYDDQGYRVKPSGDEVGRISNKIARSARKFDRGELKRVITKIGSEGCTFCPATFKNGKRNKDNFEQQQLFALDFDNKDPGRKVSFEDIRERADQNELSILFAYDTLSSTDHDKFRVVFANDVPIHDRRVAEAVQLALGEMFPEADPSCFKDASKLYYGGKKLIYYDDSLPETSIESVFRNYTYYTRKKYKDNHYKEHIRGFSKKTGIALTEKGLLDVTVTDHLPETDDPTEDHGATQYSTNGKNSPIAIIYDKSNSNIIEDGEIFPNKYYLINFSSTRNSSVKTPGEKSKNHKKYRSGVLRDMDKCKLFLDFANGSRKLPHHELFGIATNLIPVETGTKYFMKTIFEYPNLYPDDVKNGKWEADLSYMEQNDYYPQACDKYCPYHKECIHCKNILSTVHPKRGSMERVSGCHEEFCSLKEMQDDIYNAVNRAFYASGRQFYIIKAQVGGGKSHSYIKLMKENSDTRFIIAVPTNLLKEEIYENAKSQGIKVRKTPSLEKIKDEIPDEMWEHIQKLYKRGRHRLVHPYIKKRLEKEKIPCLEEYLKEREKLKTWDGCVITTHRYLLSMDKRRIDEFDAVIVDEDILFKSIISNQGEISIPKLDILMKKTENCQLKEKIRKILKDAETQSCIGTQGFEWDATGGDKATTPFDLPAFCSAEQFYVRKKEDEKNLKKDTVAFLKPVDFPGEKYIIVSATADKEIYEWYFGKGNVDFYECKKAEYMGELKQYCGKSMSRTCLANNPGMVESLMHRFGMGGDNVITFMNQGIGELHFGNTEGSNMLEGQDILVIGTPYHAEFIYKLAAFSMGLEFDEDEKMQPQTISHNGYRFQFTTFQDEGLRKVHLWMIESELEQAVGRARLLRNRCEVHLFSNFPLNQSEMVEDFDYKGI